MTGVQGRIDDDSNVIHKEEKMDDEEIPDDSGDKDEMENNIREIKSDYFTNQIQLTLSLSSIKVCEGEICFTYIYIYDSRVFFHNSVRRSSLYGYPVNPQLHVLRAYFFT